MSGGREGLLVKTPWTSGGGWNQNAFSACRLKCIFELSRVVFNVITSCNPLRPHPSPCTLSFGLLEGIAGMKLLSMDSAFVSLPVVANPALADSTGCSAYQGWPGLCLPP